MARSDMSDLEWEFIKAVLPNKSRGVKRVDGRRVINGIFYVPRTGIPWADLPEQYGPPTTLKKRPASLSGALARWVRDENSCTYQSGRPADPV